MSEEKNPLLAMLEQYEKNSAPKYEKKASKEYDLKNYFNTYIKEGVKSATKQIRILPPAKGKSPFIEIHAHKVQVDGEWKTFPCLRHEKEEACPFCEAYDALRATGKESDKELAKKFNAKKLYVVKVIDRDNEEDGVKFWRFNHDYRKEGIYDKIMGVLNAIKKDITNAETGRDLLITINRNQNNIPVVSAVSHMDPSTLSEDSEKLEKWLTDERTWEDVYSTKNYDYLAIIVTGGIPVWDKETNSFVDKATLTSDDKKSNTDDNEINMGIENVKSTIVTAETKKTVETVVNEEDEDDELPF
jgi:hypothetical protein